MTTSATTPDFHRTLAAALRGRLRRRGVPPQPRPQPFDAVFLKGEHAAAYSGFEGRTTDGSSLTEWLRGHDVTDVDVCGIATDYCVRATALDAVRNGFRTRLLESLTAGVAPESTRTAIGEMRRAGVTIG